MPKTCNLSEPLRLLCETPRNKKITQRHTEKTQRNAENKKYRHNKINT